MDDLITDNSNVTINENVYDEVIYSQSDLPFDVFDSSRKPYDYGYINTKKKYSVFLFASSVITIVESFIAGVSLNKAKKANKVLENLGLAGILSANSSKIKTCNQFKGYITFAFVRGFYMWIISMFTLYAKKPEIFENSKMYNFIKDLLD